MLIIILLCFDISSLTRAIFDHLFATKDYDDYSFSAALNLVFGAYLDILPIVLVLIIHSRNFKTIRFGARHSIDLSDNENRQSRPVSSTIAIVKYDLIDTVTKTSSMPDIIDGSSLYDS